MTIHDRRHTDDRQKALTRWVCAKARYKLFDHLRKTGALLRGPYAEDTGDSMERNEHVAAEGSFDFNRFIGKSRDQIRRPIEFVGRGDLSISETASRCFAPDAQDLGTVDCQGAREHDDRRRNSAVGGLVLGCL